MNLIDVISNQAKVLTISPTLPAQFRKMVHRQRVVLVALCGETAAGKTTLTHALQQQIPNISIISADNYFCDISALIKQFGSFTKLVESGYYTDSPENFQMDTLQTDLSRLKAGRSIRMPRYDMLDGSSTPKAVPCHPTKFVVVEGICTLYPQVRDLFDLKIYLSVNQKIQWERYQARACERGQNPSEIRLQFDILSRAAQKYIIPNKAYADLVIETKEDASKRHITRQPVTRNITYTLQNERA